MFGFWLLALHRRIIPARGQPEQGISGGRVILRRCALKVGDRQSQS
jgi:hypothetical protein